MKSMFLTPLITIMSVHFVAQAAGPQSEDRKAFRMTALKAVSLFSQVGQTTCSQNASGFEVESEDYRADDVHLTGEYVIAPKDKSSVWKYKVIVIDSALMRVEALCDVCS